MSEIIYKLLFLFLSISSTGSINAELEKKLELRPAAFLHSSERFRKIYGYVSASYQLETSIKACDSFDGWLNFDWFSKKGKSDGVNNLTKVGIANISLGIKFPYELNERLTTYIGIGPSFSKIYLNNECECSNTKTSKLVVGAVLKTGIYYFINKQLFIDAFVDYLYQPANFETHIDIGGFKIGAGIGLKF